MINVAVKRIDGGRYVGFGATRRICKEQSDGIAKRPHADSSAVQGQMAKEKPDGMSGLELLGGFEPPTSSLPRTRSTY